MVQRFPNGWNGRSNAGEDLCGRVTYTYDTNPLSSGFSQYSNGRLTTVQYAIPTWNSGGSGCSSSPSTAQDTYAEMYSYDQAGAVTAKNLQLQRVLMDSGFNEYTAA